MKILNDFRRLTSAGIEQILRQTRFNEIEIEVRSTDEGIIYGERMS